MKKENETNEECFYYNFGNNPNFDYPCPREYGAMCEFYGVFFSQDEEGLKPNCFECGVNKLEKEVNVGRED